jgi:hypothetical protein
VRHGLFLSVLADGLLSTRRAPESYDARVLLRVTLVDEGHLALPAVITDAGSDRRRRSPP